jgi:hypothetical protein
MRLAESGALSSAMLMLMECAAGLRARATDGTLMRCSSKSSQHYRWRAVDQKALSNLTLAQGHESTSMSTRLGTDVSLRESEG